jgi:lipopolysaccharide biosynthesis glycosyltransferase
MRIFIGTDPRQPIAWLVLANSIARHASKPVEITPLVLKSLPIKRRGLTEFTYSRFLVPYLCNFGGRALFLDADMVVTGDIWELDAFVNYKHAVSVMQQQQKFEWASAMFFNCGKCDMLTPEFVDDPKNSLFDMAWARDIGEFPAQWNHCVGYAPPRTDASLYHYTKGLPVWKECQGNPEDKVWFKEAKIACSTCTYEELMGGSVHAKAS